MQYTAIFHGCKNGKFQMKNYDIFLIFALNIDCGYTLEPPHNLCFTTKTKEKKNVTQFYYTKVECKGVYITLTCLHETFDVQK